MLLRGVTPVRGCGDPAGDAGSTLESRLGSKFAFADGLVLVRVWIRIQNGIPV